MYARAGFTEGLCLSIRADFRYSVDSNSIAGIGKFYKIFYGEKWD